jgi:AraC-like DNA-binding protein
MSVPRDELQIPALEPPHVHLAHYRPDVAGKLEIPPRINFNWQILYLLSAHEFRCRLGWMHQNAPCLYVIPPKFPYAASMRSYRHYSCHFSAAEYFSYADVLKAHRNIVPDGWRRTRVTSNPVTIELDGARWNLVNAIRHRGDVAARFQELIDRYRKSDRFGARTSLYRLLSLLANADAPAKAESRIQAFTDFLTHRIHEDRSVEELAAECHLSRSQLNRLCREVYGAPAKELVLREKLALAEVLLGRGTPVNETARACGFTDPYYFSRLYRNRKGVPPSRAMLNGM